MGWANNHVTSENSTKYEHKKKHRTINKTRVKQIQTNGDDDYDDNNNNNNNNNNKVAGTQQAVSWLVLLFKYLAIISMTMNWIGHVESIEGKEMRTEFWMWNLKERDHLKDVA